MIVTGAKYIFRFDQWIERGYRGGGKGTRSTYVIANSLEDAVKNNRIPIEEMENIAIVACNYICHPNGPADLYDYSKPQSTEGCA